GCPLKFVPLPMLVILICVATVKVNLLGNYRKGFPFILAYIIFTGHQCFFLLYSMIQTHPCPLNKHMAKVAISPDQM
ncbi:MAG: hypothetical protein VB075_18330, partial [Petrimonas sp.]|nr:hypothetical protein [Petrimonas sp.]